ncbi:MAG: DUF6455 family protein [Rhodoferax sp.]|uniref:DUF6455 family protein n=2 Tax=Burkholderiales TaxID=80840 RepID=UPI00272F321C|nr:DUF6455 family protein [Rhodoferax sp.]MDP1531302.1 DUF6455 family protein [Rhodoferax sp.]MDP1942352.1 DUF6455 family protein [Rhodoferax sp.]MDP2440083.1 DUF6455 family protein [Rhodoferax sp.]
MFKLIQRADDHSALFHGMTKVVGADFGRELEHGIGRADGLRSLMLKCARCQKPDDCGRWLEEHAEGASHPPEFCPNQAALARLA